MLFECQQRVGGVFGNISLINQDLLDHFLSLQMDCDQSCCLGGGGSPIGNNLTDRTRTNLI